jgi:diphosphomevalonate decarboxylase
MNERSATAIAHANIALAKYWGKREEPGNFPAVPSLSLTLAPLRTKTRVSFDASLPTDSAMLDGEPLAGRPLARVVELLDRVRELAGLRDRARVESRNEVPTAAGLASSASGFAALALAALGAAGLPPELAVASDLARASSASAARSVYGGWVELELGARSARRVAPPEHLPVAMLVAVTASGPKAVSSTEGMQRTARTSPYHRAWIDAAPALFAEARRALVDGDLETLGTVMEQSALAMHASMLAARPAIVYFRPATLAVMHAVSELRARGVAAFYTMDAGPHVKVLTTLADEAEVTRALAEVPGVERVIACRPGPDARLGSEADL